MEFVFQDSTAFFSVALVVLELTLDQVGLEHRDPPPELGLKTWATITWLIRLIYFYVY